LNDPRRRPRLQRALSDSSRFLAFDTSSSFPHIRRSRTADDVLRAVGTDDEGL
jgi:hypothetical protein